MTLKIIGHRGSGRTDNNPFAAGKPPQHTEESYLKAIADGADGFEFDIFLTKDGVPVVIHRKAAEELPISDLNVSEAQALDLPDGQKIMTLEQTLVFLAELNQNREGKPPVIVNAELKGPGVARPTCDVIERVVASHGLDKNVIYFDSLQWERLAEMRQIDPDAQLMPALSTVRLFNIQAGASTKDKDYDPLVMRALARFIKDNDCCGVDVMTGDIRPEMIDLARELNVGFCSYPQGPQQRENADIMFRNIGVLAEFAKSTRQPVIMKVDDVAATRELAKDASHQSDNELTASQIENIERIMGMHFTQG